MDTLSSKITYIYALCDPDTAEVRYIGKAAQPRVRLKQHMEPSRSTKHCHRNHWFGALRRAGLTPILRILACIPETEWQGEERWWIALYRFHDARLANNSPGGDSGLSGWHHTAETKERIRRAMTGIVRSEAHRKHQSEAQKGKVISPELRDKLRVASTRKWETSSPERRARILAGIAKTHEKECAAARGRKIAVIQRGRKQASASSQYIGVCLHKQSGRWMGRTKHDGKGVYLGCYGDEQDAARAYDRWALEVIGAHARVNFPT